MSIKGVRPSRDGLAEMDARDGLSTNADVAEAAFRRGFQQGIFIFGQELCKCRTILEALRLLNRADKIAFAMRHSRQKLPLYGDVFETRLTKKNPAASRSANSGGECRRRHRAEWVS